MVKSDTIIYLIYLGLLPSDIGVPVENKLLNTNDTFKKF